jgi:hypothetical protein
MQRTRGSAGYHREARMYIAMIVALMLVLPVASILFEVVVSGSAPLTPAIVQEWFVFWAVGVRLLLAGFRQIVQPSYTAKTILGLESEESFILVRELGFATTAIGAIGATSLAVTGWRMPMALVGAIFYALAGANHVTHEGRTKFQNVAMISDLFIAVVLVACCLGAALF